jgi:hypothetical protein
LLRIRHIYLRGRGIKINRGQSVSFWLDNWMGDTPLCQTYPVLYDEAINKNSSVWDVKMQGWVVRFRTRLQGVIRDQWYAHAIALNNFPLNDSKDEAYWKWTTSKKFTVKSVYEHLTRHDNGPDYKRVWKAKIPEKIKIFMWLVEQNSILTKDNMLKRNWQGDPCCYFCDNPENMDHLLFECPIAKVVCGVIAICFHKKCRPLSYAQYCLARGGGGSPKLKKTKHIT